MWRLKTGGNCNRVGGICKGDPSRSVSAAGIFLKFGEGEFPNESVGERFLNNIVIRSHIAVVRVYM